MNTIATAQAHWKELTIIATIFVTPAIATMPDTIPTTWQAWWTWFYDYTHQLANSRGQKKG